MMTVRGDSGLRGLLIAGLALAAVVALGHAERSEAAAIRLSLDAHPSSSKARVIGPVSTRRALRRGRGYFVTVQGTISYHSLADWQASPPCGPVESRPMFRSRGVRNGMVGIDPAFTFAASGSDPALCVLLPARFTRFQISVGGRFAHPEPIGGYPAAPAANHRYRYFVRGRGRRARFRLLDAYPQDNYGRLRISIRAAPRGFRPPAVPPAAPPPTPPPPP
jgi:hypothetical protein